MLEAGGWKGLAGTAIVNDPAIQHFVQSAVMALAADGQVRIDRLLFNCAAIAATVHSYERRHRLVLEDRLQ